LKKKKLFSCQFQPAKQPSNWQPVASYCIIALLILLINQQINLQPSWLTSSLDAHLPIGSTTSKREEDLLFLGNNKSSYYSCLLAYSAGTTR
jgi:hypothetical protein